MNKTVVVKTLSDDEFNMYGDKLYADNDELTPFQNPNFINLIGVGTNIRKPIRHLLYKKQFLGVFRNGEPVLIAPLFIKKDPNQLLVVLAGHFSSATNLDFIYSKNVDWSDYDNLFSFIRNKFGKEIKVSLDRLYYKSRTYILLKENVREISEIESKCVSIKICDSRDEWYSGLSKSARQNIRTSYNRLNTDDIKMEFVPYFKELPAHNIILDETKLFSERICEHLHYSESKKNIVKHALFLMKRNDKTLKALNNQNEYIGGTVYLNGELAAYCQGLVRNDGRAIIVRLSANSKLSRYSPGGLLINEFMKEFEKHSSGVVFNEFDLARGQEKYKYTYGGVEYYNYSVEMILK